MVNILTPKITNNPLCITANKYSYLLQSIKNNIFLIYDLLRSILS